jgi:hypothetical protein
MASILFLGGLAPAIGMIGGGELGGDGVRSRGDWKLSFLEEKETTKDLKKRLQGLRE